MNHRIEDILPEIERRRDAQIDLCDSCEATGIYDGNLCPDCLGQKILLSSIEYDLLLSLSDNILDAEVLE